MLGYLANRAEALGDPKVLDPYMATIRSHKTAHGLSVEKFEDMYAGRSLAKTGRCSHLSFSSTFMHALCFILWVVSDPTPPKLSESPSLPAES